MSTQHTPGPWNCMRASSAGRHIVCAENQPKDICVLSNRDKSSKEIEANAILIAAAPETASERDRLKVINAELLKALKNMIDWLDDGNRTLSDACALDVFKARAAIAKAGA